MRCRRHIDRRRYVDAIIRKKMHNDGLKDIISSINRKGVELVNKFKASNTSDKVKKLLGILIKACAGLLLVKGAVDLKNKISGVESARKALLAEQEAYDEDSILKSKIDALVNLSKAAVANAKEQAIKVNVIPADGNVITRTIGQNSGGTGKVHLAGGGYKGNTAIAY